MSVSAAPSVPNRSNSKAGIIVASLVGVLALIGVLVWLSLWLSGDNLGGSTAGDKASDGYDLTLTNRAAQTLWVTCWADDDVTASYIRVPPATTVGLRLADDPWLNEDETHWYLCQSSTQQVFSQDDNAILDGLTLLLNRSNPTEARCTADSLSDCREVYIGADGELSAP